MSTENLKIGAAQLHVPRKVPGGRFIWHNHVQHRVGMSHGFNGFRYRNGLLPADYRVFMRCHCGVTDLPHHSIRAAGPQKCVSQEQVLRNCGFSAKEVKAMLAAERAEALR